MTFVYSAYAVKLAVNCQLLSAFETVTFTPRGNRDKNTKTQIFSHSLTIHNLNGFDSVYRSMLNWLGRTHNASIHTHTHGISGNILLNTDTEYFCLNCNCIVQLSDNNGINWILIEFALKNMELNAEHRLHVKIGAHISRIHSSLFKRTSNGREKIGCPKRHIEWTQADTIDGI